MTIAVNPTKQRAWPVVARNASLASKIHAEAILHEPALREAARREGVNLAYQNVPQVLHDGVQMLFDVFDKRAARAVAEETERLNGLMQDRPSANGISTILASLETDFEAALQAARHIHRRLVDNRDRSERALRALFDAANRTLTEDKPRSLLARIWMFGAFFTVEIATFTALLMHHSPRPIDASVVAAALALAILVPNYFAGQLARFGRLPGRKAKLLAAVGVAGFLISTASVALVGTALRETSLAEGDLIGALRSTLGVVLSGQSVQDLAADLRNIATLGIAVFFGAAAFVKGLGNPYLLPGEAALRAEVASGQDAIADHVADVEDDIEDLALEAQEDGAFLVAEFEDYALRARQMSDHAAASAEEIACARQALEQESHRAVAVYSKTWGAITGTSDREFGMPLVDASGPCQRAAAMANAALEEALRAESMAEKARLDQAELKDAIDARKIASDGRLREIISG